MSYRARNRISIRFIDCVSSVVFVQIAIDIILTHEHDDNFYRVAPKK